MSHIDYPYSFDGLGRTAETSPDDHIRDLIEQVLFTAPGERVNRPSFGSGLLQMLFSPTDDALSATVQMSVHSALQQCLGDRIRVDEVRVQCADSTVRVTVNYTMVQTAERRSAQFERGRTT